VKPLIGLAAVAIALAGCSSVMTSATNGAPTIPSTAPSSRTTASPKPASTAADPTSQLLSISDFPTGWAIDNSPDTNDSSTPSCLATLKTSTAPAKHASVAFQYGTSVPKLAQSIGTYPTSAAASASFGRGSSILDGCTDISITSEGKTITGSIGALSFPSIGDQSKAWSMVFSTDGVTVGFDVVLLQKAAELEEVIIGDLGTPSITGLTTYCAKALAKMP
jgi:hypothetical protein